MIIWYQPIFKENHLVLKVLIWLFLKMKQESKFVISRKYNNNKIIQALHCYSHAACDSVGNA